MGMAREIALTALVATALTGLVIMPFYGHLGDRLGQHQVYLVGTRSAAGIWVGFILAYNLGPTLLLSVQPSPLSRIFHPGMRYTGMSLAYQVSAILGGFTPLISLWLLDRAGGSPWPVASLLVCVAMLSFVSVYLVAPPQHDQPTARNRDAPVDV